MKNPFDESDGLAAFYEQIDSLQIRSGDSRDAIKLAIEIANHRYLIRRGESNGRDIGLEEQSIIGPGVPFKYQVFVIALLYGATGYRPDCFEE